MATSLTAAPSSPAIPALSPAQLFKVTRACEGALSRLLTAFVTTGLLFMGQRILPAFAGMRMLWSRKLRFVGLAFITLGCTLRIS